MYGIGPITGYDSWKLSERPEDRDPDEELQDDIDLDEDEEELI